MTAFGSWQKSSYSEGGDGNTCLELAAVRTPARWLKSSFSGGGDGNNCVELATTPGTIHLRESHTPATYLTTTPASVAHLLRGIKTTTFG